jgi:hypothetical protein
MDFPQGNRIWSLRLLKAGSTSWGSGAINSDRGYRNAEEPASVRSFARSKGSSAVNHLPDFSYAIALTFRIYSLDASCYHLKSLIFLENTHALNIGSKYAYQPQTQIRRRVGFYHL